MNTTFKTLYGINADTVQKTCIIMPFDIPNAAKQLGVTAMTGGKLFTCGQGQGFTLIRSGMGAGFVGDCVLWLDESPCQNIFFLGTCGLVKKTDDIDIGTLLTPDAIYPLESFSNIITGKMSTPQPIQADHSLLEMISLNIPRKSCVCFPSLHEESKHISFFNQLGADVIEMECAAFFSAAKKIHRRSSALLIISDILGDKNFCFNLSSQQKESLTKGIGQAVGILQDFCAN